MTQRRQLSSTRHIQSRSATVYWVRNASGVIWNASKQLTRPKRAHKGKIGKNFTKFLPKCAKFLKSSESKIRLVIVLVHGLRDSANACELLGRSDVPKLFFWKFGKILVKFLPNFTVERLRVRAPKSQSGRFHYCEVQQYPWSDRSWNMSANGPLTKILRFRKHT